jgi:hypothetical protein
MSRSLGGMFLLWKDFCGRVSSKFPSPYVIANLIGMLVDEAMGNSKLVSFGHKRYGVGVCFDVREKLLRCSDARLSTLLKWLRFIVKEGRKVEADVDYPAHKENLIKG